METNETFMERLSDTLYRETGIYSCHQKYCGQLTIEDIFTTDAVYIAAIHCATGFMDRPDTRRFMDSPWTNAKRLAEKVQNGEYAPTYRREREILERGKRRKIKPPTFECKVVQKVLCDYLLRPLLESRMINTNYASVRGRGTQKLYEEILKGLNKSEGKNRQIVMTDFSGYFGSINVGILVSFLSEYIQDIRILTLFALFADEGGGLSLGNESSQVPASYFPSVIDHYLKDRLGCHFYYRYQDDILMIAKDEDQAEVYLNLILELSESIGLTIKPEKIQIVPYGQSFSFCKERFVFNKKKNFYYRIMNPQIERNEMRKLKAFAKKVRRGEMKAEDAKAQYQGVRGNIASRPNTRKCVERLDQAYLRIPEVEKFWTDKERTSREKTEEKAGGSPPA